MDCSNWKKSTNFKRIVKSCGGLPRCLEYLSIILAKESNLYSQPFVGSTSYFDQLVVSLSTAYKFHEQERRFGGRENIKVVLAMTVNALIVTPGTKLHPKKVNDTLIDITIEDVMKEGVIFVIPTGNDAKSYKVFLPLVFIHCLNMAFGIFNLRFDEVVKKDWNWKSFEEWDCKYQLIKNNSWLWLSELPTLEHRTDLSTLYACDHIDSRNKQLLLCEILDVAYEKKTFLVKDTENPGSPQGTILTDIGEIPSASFTSYSFRCCTNNPSVDCRVFHQPQKNDKVQKPWLICKQYKHSGTGAKLSLDKMNKSYIQWDKRMRNFFPTYRCFYVLITNQPIEEDDLKQFTNRFCVSVVCKNNFGSYCALGFSVYSVFDDDLNQQEEEMFIGVNEITPFQNFTEIDEMITEDKQ
jgi:hypothetical protein